MALRPYYQRRTSVPSILAAPKMARNPATRCAFPFYGHAAESAFDEARNVVGTSMGRGSRRLICCAMDDFRPRVLQLACGSDGRHAVDGALHPAFRTSRYAGDTCQAGRITSRKW